MRSLRPPRPLHFQLPSSRPRVRGIHFFSVPDSTTLFRRSSTMAATTAMQRSNRLRTVFTENGGPSYGIWQMLPGANISRALARARPDWIMVDCEHGNIDGTICLSGHGWGTRLPLGTPCADWITRCRHARSSAGDCCLWCISLCADPGLPTVDDQALVPCRPLGLITVADLTLLRGPRRWCPRGEGV